MIPVCGVWALSACIHARLKQLYPLSWDAKNSQHLHKQPHYLHFIRVAVTWECSRALRVLDDFLHFMKIYTRGAESQHRQAWNVDTFLMYIISPQGWRAHWLDFSQDGASFSGRTVEPNPWVASETWENCYIDLTRNREFWQYWMNSRTGFLSNLHWKKERWACTRCRW